MCRFCTNGPAPVAPLPSSIDAVVRDVAAERVNTIHDLRRWLGGLRGRQVELLAEGGLVPLTEIRGRFLDVVHDPRVGVSLILWIAPMPGHPIWGAGRVRVPVAFIRHLPDALHAVAQPREAWCPVARFRECPRCRAANVPGRFCARCGQIVRQGRERRVLGHGFWAHQHVLRAAAVATPCRAACGAVVAPWEAFCGKCGAPEDCAPVSPDAHKGDMGALRPS